MNRQIVSDEDQFNQENKSLTEQNKKRLKDYISKSKVTSVFICIITVMFIIEVVMTKVTGNKPGNGISMISSEVLVKMGGNVPYLVTQGQIYRLFTATLLHAGALHFLMNSFCLIGFCASIQATVPTKTYLIVYLLSGIYGNLLFVFFNTFINKPIKLAIGASTSLCGIIGLFFAMVFVLYMKGQDVNALKKNVIFTFVTLVIISLIPGVDFAGHMGGLLSGLFLGLILIPDKEIQLRKVRIAGILCFVVFTLMLLSTWFI